MLITNRLNETMLNQVKKLNVGGMDLDINYDFKTCIKILQLFESPDLMDHEKQYVTLGLLFVETIPPELYSEASKQAVWFLDGGVEGLSKSITERVYSWEQDLRFIISATDKVLGYSSRERKDLHWWVFLSAFSEIGESVFGTIVHHRRQRKSGRQSREEKEWWSENIDIAKLNSQECTEDQEKKREFEELLKGEK